MLIISKLFGRGNRKSMTEQGTEYINELKDFRPLTIRERWEIYARLTIPQRKVIDGHRKFLIRSAFIEDSYLNQSDWEFVDLKIDETYPKKDKTERLLYCECGRRLKFQYILRSKTSGDSIRLGIQHFKDHLNMPSEVAKEVNQRMNQVDFGLDELLWRKRHNQDFPLFLWKNLADGLYIHQLTNSDVKINERLIERIRAFKEANMPIYQSDMRQVEAFILEIEKDSLKTVTEEDRLTKEYESYVNRLSETPNIADLFDQMLVWSHQIKANWHITNAGPTLPPTFFSQLWSILEQSTDGNQRQVMKKLHQFSNKGMGKWLQPVVYEELLSAYTCYGPSADFLANIPSILRDGFSPFIVSASQQEVRNEEAEIRVVNQETLPEVIPDQSILEMLSQLDSDKKDSVVALIQDMLKNDK